MQSLYVNMHSLKVLFLFLQLVTVRQVAGEQEEKKGNYYMCGDTCTHNEYPCLCGSTALTYWHTQHYCCLPPGEGCSARNKKTVCRRGKAVHKSEPCHGACNEESEDTHTGVEGTCGYTDQCHYGRYMCGDICTDDQNGCMCGNSTLTSWHTQHYCCLPPEERCSVRVLNKKLVTVCRRGRAVHKSEPCHGACNEESEASVEGTCGYTDQCLYNNVKYMCGNICTESQTSASCTGIIREYSPCSCSCAGTQLRSNSSEYCCTSQEDLRKW